MVAVLLLLLVLLFVGGDLVIRLFLQHRQQEQVRRQRAAALDTGLKLTFADQAVSLKRVEVPDPKARILAVDDEDIVLDSFRRILVLDGYCVDTVSSGPEALTLVKRHPYDFVFTDMKMPEMDGVAVTKAVKHLRPDVDVIVITGYATVETAVETMKFGAMEYVQKPFTAEELTQAVGKFLIRRQERETKKHGPKLLVGRKGKPGDASSIHVLPGLFIAPNHIYVSMLPDGRVRIGIDDFVQRLAGPFDEIKVLEEGWAVKRGETFCTVRKGEHRLDLACPVSGTITAVHRTLVAEAQLAALQPYETAYLCVIETSNLAEELAPLRVGAAAVEWYGKEIGRYVSERGEGSNMPLERFGQAFLKERVG